MLCRALSAPVPVDRPPGGRAGPAAAGRGDGGAGRRHGRRRGGGLNVPADAILVLAWLVLAHLVADFAVQPCAVVTAKNSRGSRGWVARGAHGLGVAACLIPIALAFGVPGL